MHAAPSRWALARPSASPARALCSLDSNQNSLLRPAKLQKQQRRGNQIGLLATTSGDQSALRSSSSRRFAAPSRAGAVVARARAELKALIFDCDGASITKNSQLFLEKEKREKGVFSFPTTSKPFFPFSNPSRLTYCTVFSFFLSFFLSLLHRRHPRVRGPPPPRLQRHFRPLRPPLPGEGVRGARRVV